MKIKRYIAKNMKEACDLIKNDLGPDAVILNSRKIRDKGIKGFFTPRKVEVTAAIDQKGETKEEKPNPPGEYKNDFKQLRAAIKKVASTGLFRGKKEGEQDRHSTVGKYRDILYEMEVHDEIIDEILKEFSNGRSYGDEEEVEELVFQKISSIFKPVTRENQKSNVLTFVGPPGVGKTTTLAKLGAQFSLFNGLNIGLITIDTYRIGAVQQLETYGEIMGVSVDVVMSPSEMKKAIEKNKSKDLILIDTAGRPSKNSSQIAELKVFLDVVDPIDVYLVLSSEIKNRDMIRMLKDYRVLEYSKLIFTKMDETDSYGTLLNAAYITGMPIAYITTGQNVPDDIETGDPDLLAKLILGEVVL